MAYVKGDNLMVETVQQSAADAISDRLFGAMLQLWDVASTFLGTRLGYYRALAELGKATSSELAAKTNTNERYTREWLEQQAGTGLIAVAVPSTEGMKRSYSLIAGTEALFTDMTGEQPILHFGRAVMA